MKVIINNQSYWVKWEHHLPNTRLIKGKYRHTSKGKTVCHIYNDSIQGAPFIVSSAVSFLNKNDQYNKDIGRKLSLERALLLFDKSERKYFWETYNNRKND